MCVKYQFIITIEYAVFTKFNPINNYLTLSPFKNQSIAWNCWSEISWSIYLNGTRHITVALSDTNICSSITWYYNSHKVMGKTRSVVNKFWNNLQRILIQTHWSQKINKSYWVFSKLFSFKFICVVCDNNIILFKKNVKFEMLDYRSTKASEYSTNLSK